MANLRYYINPLETEFLFFRIKEEVSLRELLRELKLSNTPIQVTLNGEIPEEVSLDYVITEQDDLEIRRVLHGGGGGDAGTKQTLATIVQIAALVTATFFTGGTALLIVAAGSIASGALNKWASDISRKSARQDKQKEATRANDYSAFSAGNQARPLEPLPIVFGSQRYAPDLQTEPLRSRYGINFTSLVDADPLELANNPGIIASNGPMAANNSWINMPSGFYTNTVGLYPDGDARHWPRYPVKVSPYGIIDDDRDPLAPLSPTENANLLNIIKGFFDNIINNSLKQKTNWIYNQIFISQTKIARSPLVYHYHASDTFRGRFNLLWAMERSRWPSLLTRGGGVPLTVNFTDLGYYQTTFDDRPIPTAPPHARSMDNSDWMQFYLHNGDNSLLNNLLTTVVDGKNSAIPKTMNAINGGGTPGSYYRTQYMAFVRALNGGTFTTSDKTTTPDLYVWLLTKTMIQESPGQFITHQVFNFGVGDFDISERKISSISVDSNSSQAGKISINQDPSNVLNFWRIPNTTIPVIGEYSNFFDRVKRFPDKALINPDIKSGLVSETDMGTYNFNYFRAPMQNVYFYFAISGRLYKTKPTGFEKNVFRLQIQWRWSDNNYWTNFNPMIVTIENDNTNLIYIPHRIPVYPSAVLTPPSSAESRLEVRIRKVFYDYDDSENDNIADLAITDACFYEDRSLPAIGSPSPEQDNVGQILEGVYTTSLVTDSSQTNNYTALVESKCWYYDFSSEEWKWGKTRNPAFWFLYFARGGFLNRDYDERSTPFSTIWPQSPTLSWVNYPDVSGNTSHVFGGGYKDEEIDLDQIIEWAGFCDDFNLNLDMVVRDDLSVAETLEKIANVGRASVTYNVGKLSIVIEDPLQVPSGLYGMSNILAGSFSVDYLVTDDVRKVILNFTNRDSWEMDQVEAFVPFSKSDTVKTIEVTIDGLTDKGQAQREANILAARQFYQRRMYKWKTDSEGRLSKRGDLVYLSHDSTQFGFSGRVTEFIFESGVIAGFKTGQFLDSDIEWVTLKLPNGELHNYECEVIDGEVRFIDLFNIIDAPSKINFNDENSVSRFPDTLAHDYTFIADIKKTTGKIVRISEVRAIDDEKFEFVAVDEDPALWSYENGQNDMPESLNDSYIMAEVLSFSAEPLSGDKIKFLWNLKNCDRVEIINKTTGVPIDVGGQYSFSGNDLVVEFPKGQEIYLEARPIVYESSVRKSKELKFWHL